jgi:hypothetical protein
MQYLAHSESHHPTDETAPLNRGIKHLGFAQGYAQPSHADGRCGARRHAMADGSGWQGPATPAARRQPHIDARCRTKPLTRLPISTASLFGSSATPPAPRRGLANPPDAPWRRPSSRAYRPRHVACSPLSAFPHRSRADRRFRLFLRVGCR